MLKYLLKVDIPTVLYNLKNGEEISLTEAFIKDSKNMRFNELYKLYFLSFFKFILKNKLIELNIDLGKENIFVKAVNEKGLFELNIRKTNYENSLLYFFKYLYYNYKSSVDEKIYKEYIYPLLKKANDDSLILLLKNESIPYNYIQRVSFFKFLFKKMGDGFFDEYFKKYIVKFSSILKDKSILLSMVKFLKNNYSYNYREIYKAFALLSGNKKAKDEINVLSVFVPDIILILDKIYGDDIVDILDIKTLVEIIPNKKLTYLDILFDKKFKGKLINELIKMRNCENYKQNEKIILYLKSKKVFKYLPEKCIDKIEEEEIFNVFDI